MAAIVRYRAGVSQDTGRLLRGWAHVQQSLAMIWLTSLAERDMRLLFGSAMRSFLAEDVTPDLALELYAELVTSAHTWEPEYRISSMQLVKLTREGGLGLRHGGTYYREGRFGNYAIAESANALAPLAARERVARLRPGALA